VILPQLGAIPVVTAALAMLPQRTAKLMQPGGVASHQGPNLTGLA